MPKKNKKLLELHKCKMCGRFFHAELSICPFCGIEIKYLEDRLKKAKTQSHALSTPSA